MSVWLLVQILPKAEFGDFFLAFSIVVMGGALSGAFYQRVVLYQVSRWGDADESRRYIAGILFWGGLAGITVAIATASVALMFTSETGVYSASLWVVNLAGISAIEAWREISVAWYRSIQRIGLATMVQETLPNLVRVLGLLGVYLANQNKDWITIVFYAGSLIPVFFFIIHEKIIPKYYRNFLVPGDVKYGLQMLATQVVNQPARRVDVLLLGALSSSAQVAEYVVVNRVASILILGKQAITPLLTPRLRQAIAAGRHGRALVEYAGARYFSGLIALFGAFCLLVFGHYVLGIFGDYAGAQNVLMLLAIAMLFRSLTGSSGEYMAMVGKANVVLYATIFGILGTLLVAFIFVGRHGAEGMAYAMLLGAIVTNGVTVIAAAIIERVWLIDKISIVGIVAASTVLILSSNSVIQTSNAAVLFVAVLALHVYAAWRFWRRIRQSTSKRFNN